MGLTPFQIAVAEMFFSLPESDGFLLAGGAALVAQALTQRPTRDLDLFTRAGGRNAPPGTPSATSDVGPTFGLEELAGRKLVALFDRAEAGDFADVYVLVQRFGTETLLQQAGEIDRGFDRAVLASMIGTIDRFDDDDIPIDSDARPRLREFFRTWRHELLRG